MLPEIPLTTEAERLKERILSLPVTEEPFTDDLPSGLTPEDIEYYHALAFDWRSNPVPILRSAVRKYPDFPPLYTYLMEAYREKGLRAKEDELVGEMKKRFPDYLFTRLALAKEALQNEQGADAMQAALGGHLDLDKLYPERSVFHYAEVWHFYFVVGLILCERGQTSEARGVLHALAECGANDTVLDLLGSAIRMANVLRYQAIQEEEDLMVRVTPEPLPAAPVSEKPVILNHEEVRVLYTQDLGMDEEMITGILALPHETLTKDLILILDDCRERSRKFMDAGVEKDIIYTPMHVLAFLAEIKAKGATEAVLRFFSLHPDALDFWLWDEFDTGAILAIIVEDGIDDVFTWLRKPGVGSTGRHYVIEGLGQLAKQNPECRGRLISGFADLLSFLIQSKPEDNIVDAEVVSDLVCELVNLGATEHLPLIEAAYERKLVCQTQAGSLEEIRDDIVAPPISPLPRPFPTLLEFHRRFALEESGQDEDEIWQDDSPSFSYPADAPRAEPTLRLDGPGRNDPCSCGSGKKYKKCCLR